MYFLLVDIFICTSVQLHNANLHFNENIAFFNRNSYVANRVKIFAVRFSALQRELIIANILLIFEMFLTIKITDLKFSLLITVIKTSPPVLTKITMPTKMETVTSHLINF